jgi:hypothetical protein
MQEFQSIPGLAGRLFGGAHHQQGARCGGGVSPEAVKCPRCESTNTKFCYYNNYNLSQPRHFCKSCRRYWTKGGVLRNVPVGGGCRKAKRSLSSSSSSSSSASAPSTPTLAEAKNPRRASASSPRSTNTNSTNSGGSTSPSPPMTAPATTTTTTTTTPTSSSTNPFATGVVNGAPPAPIFADQAAALASLFAPPPPPLPVFSFTTQQQQPKDEEEAVQAARPNADMAPFTSLDDGIFEQLGVAAAYWNAGSCWSDDVHQDPTVYLP